LRTRHLSPSALARARAPARVIGASRARSTGGEHSCFEEQQLSVRVYCVRARACDTPQASTHTRRLPLDFFVASEVFLLPSLMAESKGKSLRTCTSMSGTPPITRP
jgi:hypothetical protein